MGFFVFMRTWRNDPRTTEEAERVQEGEIVKKKPKRRRSLDNRAYDWFYYKFLAPVSEDWDVLRPYQQAELAWIAGYRAGVRDKGKRK